MRREGRPHRFRVGFPPMGRTLNINIGEQKRDHPEGAAAASADTHAESHNRHAPTCYIGGFRRSRGYTCFETNFRQSQMSSLSRRLVLVSAPNRRHGITSANAICPSKPCVLAIARRDIPCGG